MRYRFEVNNGDRVHWPNPMRAGDVIVALCSIDDVVSVRARMVSLAKKHSLSVRTERDRVTEEAQGYLLKRAVMVAKFEEKLT